MAESELHKKIKYKAVDYLNNKGYYVARAEVSDGYYGIVDAWGIRPRDLYTMGIEVKVSRADWRAASHKDHRLEYDRSGNLKWHSLNEMIYACPANLIQPDELSPSAGLLWFHEKSGRFSCKKKPRFNPVLPGAKLKTVLGLYDPWITTWRG